MHLIEIFEAFFLICENPKILFFVIPSVIGLYIYFAYFG